MSNICYRSRRSDEEWYRIIIDCRKSGMSDAQFCHANNIAPSSLWSAIKRLRKKSFAIPQSADADIHDPTTSKQDVVKVDIVNDIQPPMECILEVAPHIDNSHIRSTSTSPGNMFQKYIHNFLFIRAFTHY